jgi:hypothetical protein
VLRHFDPVYVADGSTSDLGDELRLIRQLIRENGEHSRFLFLSER